ncbi:MAG TPA: glycosyltransferase 87 family protein [Solirubrobacteraceae bacterium]|nr:glycosyltransferase 87 family protein [Solirubrobacteraceae bacterium]
MAVDASSSLLPRAHGLGGMEAARGAERAAPGRATLALAGACALVLVVATLEVVLSGAVGHSPLIPGSPGLTGWLQAIDRFVGFYERLGFRMYLIALLCFAAAYGGLLALVLRGRLAADRRAAKWAIVLVAALNALMVAGPILFSTDVFSYIDYARLGVLHGLDPYLHGPVAANGDGIYKYVGDDWRKVPTAYGPLYTLLSYPLGLLGLKGAVWGAKAMALAASAGTLALTWRCARSRGYDPPTALLVVGANPLYVLYGLGGAHNDLIMTFFMMAAVALAFVDRDGPAAASVVAGALVKATVAAMLPFMLLARRRMSIVWGALAALVAVAVVSYPVFGLHGLDVISALNRDAALVSTDSFPNEIAHMLGKPGVFPADHTLLKAALAIVVLHLMWRTWRGYDWVAASGWALLAIAVTSTWLLAWYTLWTLPLAVVARDRRLLIATLAVQGLFVIHQTAPLFSPVT